MKVDRKRTLFSFLTSDAVVFLVDRQKYIFRYVKYLLKWNTYCDNIFIEYNPRKIKL